MRRFGTVKTRRYQRTLKLLTRKLSVGDRRQKRRYEKKEGSGPSRWSKPNQLWMFCCKHLQSGLIDGSAPGPHFNNWPSRFLKNQAFPFLLKQKKMMSTPFHFSFHTFWQSISQTDAAVCISLGEEKAKRLCLVFYLYRTEHGVRVESQTSSFPFPDSGAESITQRTHIWSFLFFYVFFAAFMDWRPKRGTGKQIGKVREWHIA